MRIDANELRAMVDLQRWNLLGLGPDARAGAFTRRRGADEKASSAVSYLLTVDPDGGTLRLTSSTESPNRVTASPNLPVSIILGSRVSTSIWPSVGLRSTTCRSPSGRSTVSRCPS